MDGYKQYIKTKVVGSDTLVVDGYADWQTDKFDPSDTQLNGTFPRQFQIQLMNERGQCLYKVVSGTMTARTQAELDAECSALPPAPPSDDQRLAAIEAAIVSILGL